jgi:NAD-dependent dihydropyrimidine dehydrogenase PreA subunit
MIRIFKRKSKNRIVTTIQRNCTKCGICISLCKRRALRFPSKEQQPIQVDNNLCVGCGKCVRKCPWGALILINKN